MNVVLSTAGFNKNKCFQSETKLAPFYQNDITFKCQILKNFDASFDIQSKVLMQGLDWQCYAFVQNVNGQQVKVMGKFLLIFQISNQESNIMLNLTLDQI